MTDRTSARILGIISLIAGITGVLIASYPCVILAALAGSACVHLFARSEHSEPTEHHQHRIRETVNDHAPRC